MSEKLYTYRFNKFGQYKIWWKDETGCLMSDTQTPNIRFWVLTSSFKEDYTEIKNKVKKYFCVYKPKGFSTRTSQLYLSEKGMKESLGWSTENYTILQQYTIEIDEEDN